MTEHEVLDILCNPVAATEKELVEAALVGANIIQDRNRKLKKIKSIIKLSERWISDQELPESSIVRAALKDVRRIAKRGK